MRILLTFHLVAWAIAFPFVRAGGLWFKKWPITDRIGAAVIVVLGVACVIAEVFVVTGTYVEFSPLLFEMCAYLFPWNEHVQFYTITPTTYFMIRASIRR